MVSQWDTILWWANQRELLAAEGQDSNTQIQRYIRLTNLVPELLEYVDEGRIKMRPAVELSFLDEDSQRDVVDEIDLNDATPSHDQTIRMRKFFEEGKLTTEAIQAIMSEEKPNQRGENCFEGRQGSTAYPEEYSHKPNGGFCVQGIGALQQVSAKQSRP